MQNLTLRDKKANQRDLKGPVAIDGMNLGTFEVAQIAFQKRVTALEPGALEKVANTRKRFEEIVAREIPIYGVTTGYGEMIYVSVGTAHETELQRNLVLSHSAGVGPCFSPREVRAIITARLNALMRGYSAVRPAIVERLQTYLEKNLTPAIPEIGSLGASGDLATLSHIAATVIGEGYFLVDGKKVKAQQILKENGLEPLDLKFKEGLALINGTSAMTGVGSLLIEDAYTQVRQSEIICALALETQMASTSPFLAVGHDLAKPHPGQIDCAANLRRLTLGSGMMLDHVQLREKMAAEAKGKSSVAETGTHIQKGYSLRCIPQVLGSVRDTLRHATEVVEIELNSSNDNPLFFEDQEIFHGANFHGQPVASVMDFVAVSLTQLGVLSERRTNRLLNRHLSQGLPEFLVKNEPGLNCGMAGAQYPATALIAENRTICSPASIQSVPSNGDNQDMVSMGLIATRNARRIKGNNDYILAVEYLAAAQSVDIRGCFDQLSDVGKATYRVLRDRVPTLDRDRFMSDEIEETAALLASGALEGRIREMGVELL